MLLVISEDPGYLAEEISKSTKQQEATASVMYFLGDLPLWSNPNACCVLEELCIKHGVPMDVLEELVGIQRERSGGERAHNVYPRLKAVQSRMG